MKTSAHLEHVFVDEIPEEVRPGIVYVSIEFATVIHQCACGCGSEVVTPLAPHGWTLTFDGATVSLSPSIGNWSLTCRSHYWIRKDRIVWAHPESDTSRTQLVARPRRRSVWWHMVVRITRIRRMGR